MTDTVVTGTAQLETQVTTTQPNATDAPAGTTTTVTAPAAKPTETIITPAAQTNVPATFPDNWRELLAGGDAKEVNRLGRLADPTALYKAYRELETKVSTGQVKFPLPENATQEQISQYRKDNGIPEKASDYELSLADGVVIGEADEPVLSHVLEVAHANNVSPKVVNELVNEMLIARQEQAAAQIEAQKVVRFQNEEALRAKWGNNFLPNTMAVKNLLKGAGELGEQLMTARLPDGSLLGNNAQAIEWLAGLALELNPAGTVVPGSMGNQAEAIDDELKKYDELMKKNIQAWHKNPEAKARQRELLDAKSKLQARGY